MLYDFHQEVLEIVNESALTPPLVWRATRRAVTWMERKFSFSFMKTTGYIQFNALPNGSNIVSTISALGASDVFIDNAVAGDGKIRISALLTPIYPGLRAGDYVQFDPNPGRMSSGYNALAGVYGQVVTANAATVLGIGSQAVIAVPSDLGLATVAEAQPSPFQIHKLAGNPYATGQAHPGIISIGKRVKSIEGDIQICSDTDLRKVLRKVKRLGTIDTDQIDVSWDSDKKGSIPSGYYQMGRAGNVSSYLLGTAALDRDEYLLLFTNFPDKAYWIRVEAFRFSDWPEIIEDQIDENYDNPLLHQPRDILLARTIIELGPALRDPELVQTYAGILQTEWQALIAADIELQDSDDQGVMSYDPYFHSGR